MNVQSVLGELEQLGYSISLDGENIRCKCLTLIEPPKDRVMPLLDTLKRNKKEAIEYLKPKTNPIPYDTLKTLYLDAFNCIGWQYGLMARSEVIQAEDRLNEVWLKTMERQATLNDFKQTLAEWEGAIKQVLKEAVNA